MGFGQTSLSGVRRGFMRPQLKTKQTHKQNISRIHQFSKKLIQTALPNFMVNGLFWQCCLTNSSNTDFNFFNCLGCRIFISWILGYNHFVLANSHSGIDGAQYLLLAWFAAKNVVCLYLCINYLATAPKILAVPWLSKIRIMTDISRLVLCTDHWSNVMIWIFLHSLLD